MRITRKRLLTFTAVCVAIPAFFEGTALAAEGDGPAGSDANVREGADGSRSSASRSLEEIVVTAQKRAERLQDVPISISVMGGKDLDRSTVQGIADELNRVPGVAAQPAFLGGSTILSIRGVTAGSGTFAASNPIAYYIDSVPFAFVRSAVVPDVNPYDLERVEVLRGPQGTLYGASAQNGVVRVLTRDADPSGFDMKMRAAGSSTTGGGANYRGDMAVNVPIVEGKVAARATVGYQDLSGWIDTPARREANDAEIRNMRLKLFAQPSEALSIGLSAWASRSDYGAPSGSREDEWRGAINEAISTDFDTYNATVGYDFSGFSIESMTSYIEFENDSGVDLSLAGLPQVLRTFLKAETMSQEVNLRSTASGPWRWTVGGIYRDSKDVLLQNRSGFAAPQVWDDLSESYAVYGEVTRSVLDGKLDLTAGLRYFEDRVSLREHSRATGAVSQLISSNEKFDAVSPRGVITWHQDENLTLYVSYAEGFRSGSHQTPAVQAVWPNIPAPEPDDLTNYELGAKGSLWNGRVIFDAAVYYIDWQDVQQQIAVEVEPGRFTTALVNGESASGAGAEISVAVEPVNGLTLAMSYSWNDLTFDADVISAGIALFDKGDRLNFSPQRTVGGSTDYVFALGSSGLDGRVALSANYISEQDVHSLLGTTATVATGDSMIVGSVRLSVESNGRWTASLFADNVNNWNGVVIKQIGLPDWDSRVRPRTIGLQLDYDF